MDKISTIIIKNLDIILSSPQKLKDKEYKIAQLKQQLQVFDEGKPINVSALDANFDVSQKIQVEQEAVDKIRENIFEAKAAIFQATKAYAGRELNLHYHDQYVRIKIAQTFADPLYKEKPRYELYYQNELIN